MFTTTPDRPSLRRWLLPAAAIVLALACGAICMRIEALNMAAGHRLPRMEQEFYDNDTAKGLVTWRVAVPFESLYRDLNNIPRDRPFTLEEQAGFTQWVEKNRAESRLRDTVGSLGLCQYPLCLLLTTLGIIGLARRHGRERWAYVISLLIAAVCLARAWHLDYFGSLGW